ncbi:MAG: ketosteroid isomerase family protein [Cyanobacteria bacterium J06634_6]
MRGLRRLGRGLGYASESGDRIQKTVQRYFDSLNQGQFVTTAALFAQTGQLIAPFEGATVGPGNIQTYLEKKAKNMSATPQQWSFSPRENDQWQVEVSGKVKTTVFSGECQLAIFHQ